MAIQRLAHDGYGQVELNNVAFRRDGRIEAQCALANGIDFVENGMLLAVNSVAKTVGYPAEGDALIALNYTSEHIYTEDKDGLKYFKVDKNGFYPRLGYLSRGDKFTTNCVSYNTGDFADDAALKATNLATTAVYASESDDGSILLKKTTAPSDVMVLMQVVKFTTMPDGQFAIQFQVL